MKPIIFSATSVRAILDGRKTQTRRLVRPQPDINLADSQFVVGRRLWVREVFSGPHCMDASDGCKAVPPSKWGDCSRIWYWADGNVTEGDWTRPRPSIHMPRWASRITLEITDVRLEQLQDISEADAQAEGVRCGDDRWHRNENGEAVFMDAHGWYTPEGYMRHNSPKHAFRTVWEEINGNGSWEKNPWVWVIEFKKLEQKEQA